MNSKAIRKQLLAAVVMVLVAAVALGSSTYAWFVNNTMVKTSQATLSATTAYALLISEGATGAGSAWTTTHTMTNASNATLEPVSTTGKNSVVYGGSAETPMTFVKYAHWATNSANHASEVDQYAAATANTEYLMESFEIKASQICDLYLDQETSITYAAASTSTLGATLRLALVVSDQDGSNPKYFFYTIDDGTTTSGAANTTFNGTTGADGLTLAVKDGNQTGAAAIGAISADNLDSGSVKQLVTATGVTSGALATSSQVGSADLLYSFAAPEDVCLVKAYIWMEGCDEDTVAANLTTLTGAGNAFNAVLGFCAK